MSYLEEKLLQADIIVIVLNLEETEDDLEKFL
jgi:hypothetical protein